jgi:HAD superfamily hydrolase (TIGR01509 family)
MRLPRSCPVRTRHESRQGLVPPERIEGVSAGKSLAALPTPRGLIFDLDGTLVDTVETRIEAWTRVFAEEGIETDRRHVAELIGADGKRLAREVAQRAARDLSDDDAERIDHRSGEIYDELNTDPRPLPGARDLLVALEASGMRWAIATSSRKEQVRASVDALRLPKQPTIIDGSHVQHAKPAPDLLLQTAERLRVAPAECWCVGDATWDMRAAKAARMVAVGVATGAVGPEALIQAGADAAISSLVALAEELRPRRLTR